MLYLTIFPVLFCCWCFITSWLSKHYKTKCFGKNNLCVADYENTRKNAGAEAPYQVIENTFLSATISYLIFTRIRFLFWLTWMVFLNYYYYCILLFSVCRFSYHALIASNHAILFYLFTQRLQKKKLKTESTQRVLPWRIMLFCHVLKCSFLLLIDKS